MVAELGVTLTLEQATYPVYTWADVQTTDIPYYAIKGEYGAGDFVQIEFTGKIIPMVAFFANQVTADVSTDSFRSLVFNGGDVRGDSNNYCAITDFGVYAQNNGFHTSPNHNTFIDWSTGLFPFSYSQLKEDGDYVMTVGFIIENEGLAGEGLYCCLFVYEKTAEGAQKLVYEDTRLCTFAGTPEGGGTFTDYTHMTGDIIIYGSRRGEFTFKCTGPEDLSIPEMNYDKETKTLTWGEVDGAAEYVVTVMPNQFTFSADQPRSVVLAAFPTTFIRVYAFDGTGNLIAIGTLSSAY